MSVKGGARAGEVSNEEMQEFRMKPSFKKEACTHTSHQHGVRWSVPE